MISDSKSPGHGIGDPQLSFRAQSGDRARSMCSLVYAALFAAIVSIFPAGASARQKPKVVLIIADRLIPSDIFGPIDPRTGEMERFGGTPGLFPVVGDLRVGLRQQDASLTAFRAAEGGPLRKTARQKIVLRCAH